MRMSSSAARSAMITVAREFVQGMWAHHALVHLAEVDGPMRRGQLLTLKALEHARRCGDPELSQRVRVRQARCAASPSKPGSRAGSPTKKQMKESQ